VKVMALNFGPRVNLAKALLELSDNIIQDVKKDVAATTLPNDGWVPELTHTQFAKLYAPRSRGTSQRTEDKTSASAHALYRSAHAIEDKEKWRRKIREARKQDRLYIIATDDESLPEQKTRMIHSSNPSYVRKALKDSPIKTKVVWATTSFLLGIDARDMRRSCFWQFVGKGKGVGAGWSDRTAGWMDVPHQKAIDYIQYRSSNLVNRRYKW